MGYVYLSFAIIAEVIGTNLLKASTQFTQLWPSVGVVVFYAISFYLLSLAFRTLSVGVAYAIWSGLGIVFVTLLAAFVFKQIPDLAAVLGMALIVIGVAVIYLFSNTAGH